MAPGIATSPGQDWAKGGGWGGIASGEVLVLDRRGVVLEVLAPYVKPVASSVVARGPSLGHASARSRLGALGAAGARAPAVLINVHHLKQLNAQHYT